jgi:outer membrane protein OmpA-like peptidoglycan-associated protein
MRKLLFIASLLASITFAQSAMAQEPADTFGTPISSAVVVSFADNSSTFRPNTEQAAHLSDAKQAALVTIRGRTSTNTPSARDEALALARALSARSYLVAHGVSPLKIAVNFASAADFVADNLTPEGRRENQRVEVELVYVTPLTRYITPSI